MVYVDGFDFPLLDLNGTFRIVPVLDLFNGLGDKHIDDFFGFVQHVDEDQVFIIGEVLQQIFFHGRVLRRRPDSHPDFGKPLRLERPGHGFDPRVLEVRKEVVDTHVAELEGRVLDNADDVPHVYAQKRSDVENRLPDQVHKGLRLQQNDICRQYFTPADHGFLFLNADINIFIVADYIYNLESNVLPVIGKFLAWISKTND